MRYIGIVIFIGLVFNNCSCRKIDRGDCYSYMHEDKENFVLVTEIFEDNTTKSINFSPIISSNLKELDKGRIIRKKVAGSDINIIWTNSIQVDNETFEKISGDFKYHKKINLLKKIKTSTGMAANNMIQFRFIDNLMRDTSGQELIQIELLK